MCSLDSFSICSITECWVEFTELCLSSLWVIYIASITVFMFKPRSVLKPVWTPPFFFGSQKFPFQVSESVFPFQISSFVQMFIFPPSGYHRHSVILWESPFPLYNYLMSIHAAGNDSSSLFSLAEAYMKQLLDPSIFPGTFRCFAFC